MRPYGERLVRGHSPGWAMLARGLQASWVRMPSAFPGSPKARKGVWGYGLRLASVETSGHNAQGLWLAVVLLMK